MRRILVIDNFDSFTYNLVQYLKIAGSTYEVTVCRNNIKPEKELKDCAGIVFSPGPGIPAEAGYMPELIREYYDKKPMLGVCLGHQCIGEIFNLKLVNLSNVYHGVARTTRIIDDEDRLFSGMPRELETGRYHSWCFLNEENRELAKNNEVAITALDGDMVMAIRHKRYPVWGVQFHPESVLTPYGQQIIDNWLAEF